jgi:hypothetical protein
MPPPKTKEMAMRREATIGLVLLLAAGLPREGAAQTRPVTVDDLMRLRWVADVRISPDGQHVAYVVSQPSVEKNVHDAVF